MLWSLVTIKVMQGLNNLCVELIPASERSLHVYG